MGTLIVGLVFVVAVAASLRASLVGSRAEKAGKSTSASERANVVYFVTAIVCAFMIVGTIEVPA